MNEYGIYSSNFQAYVAWVDHNGTLNDMQKEGPLERMSPQTGRNLHLGVYKLGGGGGGGIAVNVVVPQEVLGSFKVPQLGDIIWVEESRREYGAPPIYRYSTYNTSNDPKNRVGQSPVPQWGSFPGDHGHLRTHRDHNSQFFTTLSSNFIKKYVRSITGYRFRSFYRSNLARGRFVVRGDPVFDINQSINDAYLVESGGHIISGGGLEEDQGRYPSPLNAPTSFEEDENYSYIKTLHTPPDVRFTADHYNAEDKSSRQKPAREKTVLKNKNFRAYQPVLDKDYLERAMFEREIPAAEEYQVAIRGNNKLLIQDQYGDGEQLLITLKNQYDSGFTIVHNASRSQVRIRDHLGQGVLLEANPESPRVISWTSNRQVIEQGGVRGRGEFTYIRNGSNFGDSQASFGAKTGLTKNDVSNQELLMVSSPEIIGELTSRLSSGMNALVSGAGRAGVYIRNNVDPETSLQTYAMYKQGTNLTVETAQANQGIDGITQTSRMTQTLEPAGVTQTTTLHHASPNAPHRYSETIFVSGTGASKTSTLTRVGEDEITYSESINGPNTAIATKTISLPNQNRLVLTENAAVPSIVANVVAAAQPAADLIMTGDVVETIKYVGGASASSILQDASSVAVRRIGPGLGFTINVGDDGGTGAINIGNPAGPLFLRGATITKTSPGAITISGASIDLNA